MIRLSLRGTVFLAILLAAPSASKAGIVVSNAIKAVGDSVNVKYSNAARTATKAFLVQSGAEVQVNLAEDRATKAAFEGIKTLAGDDGAAVFGAAIYTLKCLREQRLTTRVFNPILKQKNTISVGVTGVEIAGVKSPAGGLHWVRLDSNASEGVKYSTGVSLGF